MSWDAVILRIRGPIRPVAEVGESDYLPLGSLKLVATAIRSAFPSAEWDSPTHAVCLLDKFTGILFDLKGVETANCVLVSVSGSADPISALLGLTNANGWVLLDVQTSEFIHPASPSDDGWLGYRSLLERASGGTGGERSMIKLPELYEGTHSAAAVLKVLAASVPGIWLDWVKQMRAAFDLSLHEVKSIGGWEPDGTGELDDARLDELMVPAIERRRSFWEAP